jgi:predicted DNA binding CopG/RHH family protein
VAKEAVRVPAFVSEEVRKALKMRALESGVTFQEYLTQILTSVAKTSKFVEKAVGKK